MLIHVSAEEVIEAEYVVLAGRRSMPLPAKRGRPPRMMEAFPRLARPNADMPRNDAPPLAGPDDVAPMNDAQVQEIMYNVEVEIIGGFMDKQSVMRLRSTLSS